ncbi:MAG: alpha/beta hydrolase [Bacteroidota bacterium]
MKRMLLRTFWTVVVLVCVGYGVILWWFSAHETELVYAPDRQIRPLPEDFPLKVERVAVRSDDGVNLVGRTYRVVGREDTGMWILYFHGNAGNATRRVRFHAQLVEMGVSVLVAEYRGYGESEGTPDEQGVYRDADAFYGYLRDTLGVSPERCVIFGSSLGSGVAIDVASRLPAAGLIVEGAFTSISDRGQELYPYIPVRWMARNRFASIEKIGRVTMPKLFIHAADDEIIPIAHGRRLFEEAANPKMFLEVRGDHNMAYEQDSRIFFGGIGIFLGRVRGGSWD